MFNKSKESYKFSIYNFKNEKTDIKYNKKIKSIFVEIISGDEIVTLNGTDKFESKSSRKDDFYDGQYKITDPEQIQAWLKFKPDRHLEAYGFQRKKMFTQ